MKSRWTTCLLLAAVVAIWGSWRGDLAPATRRARCPTRDRHSGEVPPQIVAETLRLDYPDPFTEGVAAPTPAARSVVRNLPPAGKAEPKRREQVQLSHLATVTAGGQTLHILTIGGRQYELSLRDTAAGFRPDGRRPRLALSRTRRDGLRRKTLQRIDETAYDIPRRGRAADGRGRSAGDAHGDAGAAGAVGAGDAALHAHAAAAAGARRRRIGRLAPPPASRRTGTDRCRRLSALRLPAAVAHLRAPRAVGPLRTAAHHDDRSRSSRAAASSVPNPIPHGRSSTPTTARRHPRRRHASARDAPPAAERPDLRPCGERSFTGERRFPARRSGARRGGFPAPSAAVAARIGALFAFAQQLPAAGDLPDSLGVSFRDPTVALRLGTAEIGGCTLRGRIVLAADELRIDSACRLGNVLVCARKITVGSGARIAAQLFARDYGRRRAVRRWEYPSASTRPVRRTGRPDDGGRLCHRPRHRAAQEDGRLLPPVAHGTRAGGFFMRMARRRCRGSSWGVRSSDRPSTSRRRDTTRICSTTLRCSKIPPRRNRCGTAAPRPCAERRPYASSKTGLGRKAARGLARRSRRSGGGAADRFHGGNGAAAPSDAARGRCARSRRSRIPGHVRLRQIRIRRMARGHYVERYGGGEATVRAEPYRQYRDVQLITIEVRIDGSRKRIVHRQLVECAEWKHTLRGSTLAETLVMMLVAGIALPDRHGGPDARLAACGPTHGRARRGGTAARRNLPPRAAAHNGRQRPRRSGRRHRRAAVPLSCRRRDDTDDARLPRQYSSRGSSAIRSCVVSGTCSSLRCDAAADTLEIDVGGHMLKLPKAAARTGKLRTKNR